MDAIRERQDLQMTREGNERAVFYAHREDLAQLSRARRICYLIGGYDGSRNYGDIAQLASNLRRLQSEAADTLLVPLLERQCYDGHQALIRQHPHLLAGACFLYFSLSGDPNRAIDDDVAELDAPPGALAKLLVYGGGFFNDWWGKRKLDAIDALTDWLHGPGEAPEPSLPVMIVSQQVSPSFPRGPEAGRFASLLERAGRVGFRDEVSLEYVAGAYGPKVADKLFLSGDDAIPYIVTNARPPERATARRLPFSHPLRPTPLTVNLHLSLESYVAGDPESLFDTAVFLVRHLNKLCAGRLSVNLVVAYDGAHVSEVPYLERLRERITDHCLEATFLVLTSDLARGLPTFAQADLTVCCSYHVALTSLALSVPAVLLYANDYYTQKAGGLRSEFPLPAELFFDVKTGSHTDLAQAVERIVRDEDYQETIAAGARRGTRSLSEKAFKTTLLLRRWLAEEKPAATSTTQWVTISQPRHHKDDNGEVVSASIGIAGEDFEIRWRVSEGPIARDANAFLASALLPAMTVGHPICCEGTISTQVASAVPNIQGVFHTWDRSLHAVSLETRSMDPITAAPGRGVGCFFSGGVDSFYSVLEHHEEITKLVFVHGFDIRLDDRPLRARVLAAIREAAAEMGKPLIEVETNVRDLSDRFGSWSPYFFGPALASVAHLLSAQLSKIYIPGPVSYAHLRPNGSHPLLDPLWSSEAIEIVHDACEATRAEKTASIASNETALKWLRVCWENRSGAYNCGQCEKCLRTMTSLRAVGALERCWTFEHHFDVSAIASLELHGTSSAIFLAENLESVERQGNDPELARALRERLSRETAGRGEVETLSRQIVEREGEVEALKALVMGYERGRVMRLLASVHRLRQRLIARVGAKHLPM